MKFNLKIPFLFLHIAITQIAYVSLFAESLSNLSDSAESRLETAIDESAEFRNKVAEQKIPIATEVRELSQQVELKRSEQQLLQRRKDNSGLEISSLESQLTAREDEIAYISNLLLDYANRLNASVHPSEMQLYQDDLLAVLNASEKGGVATDDLIQIRLSAVKMGLERIDKNAAGFSFPGEAISADGSVVEGKFAHLGPVSFFASSDGSTRGAGTHDF